MERRPAVSTTVVLTIAAVFAPSLTARASTVAPMNLATLADHAGQVIVGEVRSVRSYWADNPRRIESEIEFGAVEYLKGAPPGGSRTLRLTVPGGQIGKWRMQICCAPSIGAGEKWLLFLLPRFKTHPVVGLAQGAFRVVRDTDGIERVFHESMLPVTGLDEQGFVRVARKRSADVSRHLVAAEMARLAKTARELGPRAAMTLSDFRARLQPVLDASRRYDVTRSAGQRLPVTYKAVPFSQVGAPARPAGEPSPSGRAAAPHVINVPKQGARPKR